MLLRRRLPYRHGQPASASFWGSKSFLVRFKSVSAPNSFNIPELEPSAIYISQSTNPVWNLSFEDLLFRRTPQDAPLLLIYRNDPCVIIGRNQNPWKEINQAALKQAGIPFVRRRSGGGTVYHDLGNTNFSLHMPRTAFERKKGSTLALEALKLLNVPDVWINDRNDVCVSTYKIRSAYKIINTRAYHHGTMLLNAKLDQLGDVLRNEKDTMVGRSVTSVRSPVRNIASFQPSVTHKTFCDALVQAFIVRHGLGDKVVIVEENDLEGNEFIKKSSSELESWDWKYGQTLEFTYTLKGEIHGRPLRAEIEAKHGVITKCTVQFADSTGSEQLSLGETLVGKRYGLLDANEWKRTEERELVEWLQREM